MNDWKSTANKMWKSHRSFAYIASKTGKSVSDVKNFIHEISKKGPEESKHKTKFEAFENRTPSEYNSLWDKTNTIMFGVIGDTHINSKYTQLTHLHNFYDICAAAGIKNVYHAGDIDEGEQMRMGHQYDCYTQGADDHASEIINNYPFRDGITTHFITGNHDSSIYKRCGVDIGKLISNEREDMHYLGRDWSRVYLTPNCVMELRHPWDGSAYALSYKPQKMIDAMESDSKPNILAIGHYHKAEYLFYRNIHCFQVGCFQSQTPFARGKGLSTHIGGWIVTVNVDTNGYVKSIIPTFIPYCKGLTDDYKAWQ